MLRIKVCSFLSKEHLIGVNFKCSYCGKWVEITPNGVQHCGHKHTIWNSLGEIFLIYCRDGGMNEYMF